MCREHIFPNEILDDIQRKKKEEEIKREKSRIYLTLEWRYRRVDVTDDCSNL